MKTWKINLLTVTIAGILSVGFMVLFPSPSLYLLMANVWVFSLVLWLVIYLFTRSIKNAQKKMVKNSGSDITHV